MSTIAATNLKNASSGSNNIVLDSSGRVLVGTSSSSANSTLVLNGSSAGAGNPGILYIQRNESLPGSSSSLGQIYFADNGGNPFALISAAVDATPGSGDYPGRLVFSTTADGASSPTERLSIGNQGYIFPDSSSRAAVASVQATGSGGFKIISASTTGAARCECFADSTATRYGIVFSNPNGIVGSISTGAFATAYNSSSDYRLKENVVPLTGAIDRLNDLQVRRFNFIADPDKTVDGFIAHEAQAVVPECVTGEKDAVDDEGNPVYQGIDQSKLVPLLTAALQEAIDEIESLKGRLTAAGI
jgi:hypothetical protein